MKLVSSVPVTPALAAELGNRGYRSAGLPGLQSETMSHTNFSLMFVLFFFSSLKFLSGVRVAGLIFHFFLSH